MRKVFAVVAVLASFALILASADAQQQGKGKGRGKGKGGFGDPETTFKKLDTNNDGKLSKDEYLKIADRVQDAEKAAKFKEFLGNAYDKANTSGDGLTLEQYKKLREQRGGGRKKADDAKTDEKK